MNWLNTCIFLSGVDDAEDGGTMVCSGSHRLDVEHESAAGDPPAAVNGKAAAGSVPDWRACLAAREQIRCPAGSVLHFTESLLHAGNAVLSEQTRYAMFFEVVAPGTDRRAGWRPSFIEHPWGLTSPLRSPRTRPGAADQRPAFLGLFGPYRAHTREAREILPGLWQGPEEFPEDLISEAELTHVLTVTDDRSSPSDAKAAATRGYLHIQLADLPSQDLFSILPQAIEFIHSARVAGGSVLVHCHHGVSRSGAVILAYLCAHLGATVFQAWHFVLKVCGKCSAPNNGFESQLLEFERNRFESSARLRRIENKAGSELWMRDVEVARSREDAKAAGSGTTTSKL